MFEILAYMADGKTRKTKYKNICKRDVINSLHALLKCPSIVRAVVFEICADGTQTRIYSGCKY